MFYFAFLYTMINVKYFGGSRRGRILITGLAQTGVWQTLQHFDDNDNI